MELAIVLSEKTAVPTFAGTAIFVLLYLSLPDWGQTNSYLMAAYNAFSL
ncbi:hypothetical protein L248_1856 [Schleiferilactobacillus shenzhenensis LY-73]|uniref:Uncharacterized protein n=1 Tax=Schleiferilactobacillus shenzhenensis LY-73 TaxID=1231336 RepID=U4TQQ9_9LACO|nr:hypothetical protein L248_1856 [Schleiferilactobacillus shenzhenensis LY-73]